LEDLVFQNFFGFAIELVRVSIDGLKSLAFIPSRLFRDKIPDAVSIKPDRFR
jgi:hypothetical protein